MKFRVFVEEGLLTKYFECYHGDVKVYRKTCDDRLVCINSEIYAEGAYLGRIGERVEVVEV